MRYRDVYLVRGLLRSIEADVDLAKSVRRIKWRLVRGGPGRRPRVLTVPTTNGLLSFSNMDAVIAKGLYIDRAWELDFITKTMAYLRDEGWLRTVPSDVMLDVGANIGMICIAMLQHGYFRTALAFEPAPDNFAFLVRNVRQNGMVDRIRTYQCGLADVATEMLLELSEQNFGDHRLRASAAVPAHFGEDHRATVRVPVRTLDEVMADGDAPDPERIGLIWVDIQGHEGQFLTGARRILSRGIPVVSELWPYGIRRAGMGEVDFAEIVQSLFAHVVHVDTKGRRFERVEVRDLPNLFAAYPQPTDFGQVIFLPHRAPTK